jgi:hypothetical protein
MPDAHQYSPLVAKYRAPHKQNQLDTFPQNRKNPVADAGNQPLTSICVAAFGRKPDFIPLETLDFGLGIWGSGPGPWNFGLISDAAQSGIFRHTGLGRL